MLYFDVASEGSPQLVQNSACDTRGVRLYVLVVPPESLLAGKSLAASGILNWYVRFYQLFKTNNDTHK